MTNDAERMSDIVARLRNDQLPFCPFDSRSPLYWTAGENGAPCPVCHGTEDGPDLCRGADTRILAEAADIIEAQSKALAEAREAAERWNALMSSPRLHWMGCAGFEFKTKEGADPDSRALVDRIAVPRADEGMHFGMEFWSDARVRDERFPDTFERDFMVVYVDEIRRRAALTPTPENPNG